LPPPGRWRPPARAASCSRCRSVAVEAVASPSLPRLRAIWPPQCNIWIERTARAVAAASARRDRRLSTITAPPFSKAAVAGARKPLAVPTPSPAQVREVAGFP
jgi:hypothetical protein